MQAPYRKSYYHQGFVAVKRRAVFYVFVFDSIHNSATKHNLCPQEFPAESIRILFAPMIDAVRSSEQLEHPNR